MNCQHCGNETENPKFCSKSCASSVNNRIPKRKRKIQYCRECKKELAKGRRKPICTDCDIGTCEKLSCLTLGEARARYTKKVSPSYAHALVRHHCHMLHSHLKAKCRVCGYSTHVELCHIKAIASFPETTTFREINSMDNIVGLCPNHHWELDNGHLTL